MEQNEITDNLYVKYVDELYAFGLAMGYRKDVVMDGIHDVFFRVLSSGRSLDDISNWKAYLFRALNNRLIDSSRLFSNREAADLEDADRVPVDPGTDNDAQEQAAAVAAKLLKLIQSLPYKQRMSLYLRFFCEMSYDDIASVLSCSNHAARMSVSKGIQNLRKYQKSLDLWQD